MSPSRSAIEYLEYEGFVRDKDFSTHDAIDAAGCAILELEAECDPKWSAKFANTTAKRKDPGRQDKA